MRWQNPWAWLGLLTLVLPVLVHLFSRRQTRIEPFPTLRFIDVSRLLPTRRTQLTDVLLLLVRLLVLAAAVAALAQPLFRNRASSSVVASAVVVDTTAMGADSASRARVDRVVSEVVGASATQVRVDTRDPAGALAGAAAWLETQTATRQLVVVSDFRDGTLDSLDLVALPRDISVRLVTAGGAMAGRAVASVRDASTGDVVWLAPSVSAATVRSAVIAAVRSLGATAITDSVPSAAKRLILVAPSDADSLATWLRDARPLTRAWMGDVALRLRADTTVVTTSAGAAVSDTAVTAPFTVVARSSLNAPVIAIAALGAESADTTGTSRLLVWTRTPSDALATASVLLAASRALEPRGNATSGRSTPDSAQLRRWEKAPSAAPASAAHSRSSDALTGASDARWLWVVVLVLLGVETLMRRRVRTSGATLELSGATPTGAQDG